MASGSPPSTTSCRPRCTKGSCSFSMSGSRPSNPCLRAMVLHSTIFLISSSACSGGGLITQEKRLIACLNTGSGVWMKMEANVPTTTIMNAAADSNAWMPAPLSTAPTSTATSASTKPMAERMSTARTRRPPRSPAARRCRPGRSTDLAASSTPGTCGPTAAPPGSVLGLIRAAAPACGACHRHWRAPRAGRARVSSSPTSVMTPRMIWPVRSW